MRSVDVPPMCSVGILPMFFFFFVIPAQAGIHFFLFLCHSRASGNPFFSFFFFFVIPAQAGIHFFLFLLFFTRSHGYPAYSRGVAMPPSQPVNQSTISGY